MRLPVTFELLTDVCWWDSFCTLYLLESCLSNLTDTLEIKYVFCFCKNVGKLLMAFHWFQVLLEVDFNKLSYMVYLWIWACSLSVISWYSLLGNETQKYIHSPSAQFFPLEMLLRNSLFKVGFLVCFCRGSVFGEWRSFSYPISWSGWLVKDTLLWDLLLGQ